MRGTTISVTRTSIPSVLLLAGVNVSAHLLRTTARRAGLTIALHRVSSATELKIRMHGNLPDLIISGPSGLPQLPLGGLRKLAAERKVPLICVAETAHTNLASLHGGFQRTTDAALPDLMTGLLRRRHSLQADGSRGTFDENWNRSLRENQKLIVLGRMMASIAHEINNPLEAITNLLFLMDHEPGMPESGRRYLELAQQELARVAQISRQTLNFSRETATPVKSQLGDLLDEVLTLYSRRVIEKQLNIVRRYDLQGTARVFPGEMRQVFANLIANAIEATEPHGKIVIRVHPARKWSDHEVSGLRVSIADTGSGIPENVRRRLGEPFYTTKGQRGTGLGLWVSQSIVERYGGNLQLRSSVAPQSHGTVFSVFLPTNLRPRAVSHQGEFETPRRANGFRRPA